MQENFDIATDWMLVHEGGYVNHPDDPGGATNRGVTQSVYNGFRRRKGLTTRSVRHITDQEVHEIYKSQYWDRIWADELPHGLDYALYDFSVNSGPKRAVQFVQRLLGVEDDGIMGNVTLGAIRAKNDIEGLIRDLCINRWNWLKRLRHYKTFGRGWTRRVMGNQIEGVQADHRDEDIGVIDRATWINRSQGSAMSSIPKPKDLNDGAGAKATEENYRPVENVKESVSLDNVAKVGGGTIPAWFTAAASLPEGPLQWGFIAIAIIVTLAVVVYAFKRLA